MFLLSRPSISSRTSSVLRLARNVSSEGSKEPTTKKDNEVEGHKPLYATSAAHKHTAKAQRYQNAEVGACPTKWQRRFLVITRLYQNQAEIPEIVSHGLMDRMHDRMRVVFIVVASTFFFFVFYVVEAINARRISRDRDAGVVVKSI